MDTWNGWLPDDPSHHIARRHPLLRLCHLRSDSHHRHLHSWTCSTSRPPLPRHRYGARELRKGSTERGRCGQHDNIPHDVPSRNLLAPRDTTRYHEDHSQLHATSIRERWAERCVDLLGTSPSLDQHHHCPRLGSVLHRTRQRTDELERRIDPSITTRKSNLKFGTTREPRLWAPYRLPRPLAGSVGFLSSSLA